MRHLLPTSLRSRLSAERGKVYAGPVSLKPQKQWASTHDPGAGRSPVGSRGRRVLPGADIPSPAPPRITGAVILIAMTLGLHRCRARGGRAMKTALGIAIAFATGFICRAFGIPSPAAASTDRRAARPGDDYRLRADRSSHDDTRAAFPQLAGPSGQGATIRRHAMTTAPDLIVHNAKLTTLDRSTPLATAFAVQDGRFSLWATIADIMALRGPRNPRDRCRRAAGDPGPVRQPPAPHPRRPELQHGAALGRRGDLADAMAMLRAQVAVTPPPQWVRVVGGFTEHQFAEKRLPTLEEINAVAPDTPVFILHLYDRALLNAPRCAPAAIPGTRRTRRGARSCAMRPAKPTGLLIARPNATILYATLAKGPKLPPEYQPTRPGISCASSIGSASPA